MLISWVRDIAVMRHRDHDVINEHKWLPKQQLKDTTMQPRNTSTDCADKLVRTSTKETRQRSRIGAGREPPLPCHCVLCRLEVAILQRQRPTLQRACQRQAPGSDRDGHGSVHRSSYSPPSRSPTQSVGKGSTREVTGTKQTPL